MKPLDRWMRQKRLSTAQIAAALNVSRITVWRWLSGSRAPQRELANRIAALTEGEVPSDSWDKSPHARQRERGKARAA
jgi:transcriptional regulator with XRE-family HTH domain